MRYDTKISKIIKEYTKNEFKSLDDNLLANASSPESDEFLSKIRIANYKGNDLNSYIKNKTIFNEILKSTAELGNILINSINKKAEVMKYLENSCGSEAVEEINKTIKESIMLAEEFFNNIEGDADFYFRLGNSINRFAKERKISCKSAIKNTEFMDKILEKASIKMGDIINHYDFEEKTEINFYKMNNNLHNLIQYSGIIKLKLPFKIRKGLSYFKDSIVNEFTLESVAEFSNICKEYYINHACGSSISAQKNKIIPSKELEEKIMENCPDCELPRSKTGKEDDGICGHCGHIYGININQKEEAALEIFLNKLNNDLELVE